jgi:hypothetical protein
MNIWHYIGYLPPFTKGFDSWEFNEQDNILLPCEEYWVNLVTYIRNMCAIE